jgi:hypothetical protein
MRFWKKAPVVEAFEAPIHNIKSEPSSEIVRKQAIKHDI